MQSADGTGRHDRPTGCRELKANGAIAQKLEANALTPPEKLEANVASPDERADKARPGY